MLHLVGCLYYLYQWCTVKQISDNEIYLWIKYIKRVLWRVTKCLSYIQEARCLKVKWTEQREAPNGTYLYRILWNMKHETQLLYRVFIHVSRKYLTTVFEWSKMIHYLYLQTNNKSGEGIEKSPISIWYHAHVCHVRT